MAWARTGPGQALDGKPKFDLTKYDTEYFNRLRTRVRAAGERGIYVSVMLFEGWGLSHANRRAPAPDGWAYRSHPFHPDNNINGIRGDLNDDSNVLEIHALASPAIAALQEAYIRKVVDTVNDLDNVLFEVINEGGVKEWNWWVVKTVQDYERTKPKQHPVGLTAHGGEKTDTMLVSPADWISPGGQDGYRDPAPLWDGRKVGLIDTDHVWGIGGNQGWVWRSFLRGYNPIFMDPYDGSVLGARFDRRWEPVRKNMGYAKQFAQRLDLARAAPTTEIASTGYCLAEAGRKYLVFRGEDQGESFTVRLPSGTYACEWFDPGKGKHITGDTIEVQSGDRSFQAPFEGDAVLFINRAAGPAR